MNKTILLVGGLLAGGALLLATSKETKKEDTFQNDLIKTNSVAQQVADFKFQGLNNAEAVNAVLNANNQQQQQKQAEAQSTASAVNNSQAMQQVKKQKSTIGNKVFISSFDSVSKQIPNGTGKNYKDLGAGSDPSKWKK